MEELPMRPRGIRFQPDFITPEHEAKLLHIFQHKLTWPVSKKSGTRLSLHYGYTFDYKTFGIDPDIPYKPFPDWLQPLVPKLPTDKEEGQGRLPDQVCLQHYPPGAGIPPHVDTHSAYDELYALSLGSAVVMQFRRRSLNTTGVDIDGKEEDIGAEAETETETVDLDLPARSMMEMSGESRLHWEHGIKKRKKDVLGDGTARPRADRWSITYRWLRPGAVCECGDVRLCDTAQRRAGVEREYRWKEQLQQQTQEQAGEMEMRQGEGGGEKMGNEEKRLDVLMDGIGSDSHYQNGGNTVSSPS
ncbi:hypothetical protein F4859DRAFT_205424 [Xylaria cf. heliscus]|nr:hypothetical protein F4859DRAFT_205424 [Xylaria cf. heliscus]